MGATLRDAGVVYTPVRYMPFGSHLNFRDPDGIPLDARAPTRRSTLGTYAGEPGDVERRSLLLWLRPAVVRTHDVQRRSVPPARCRSGDRRATVR